VLNERNLRYSFARRLRELLPGLPSAHRARIAKHVADHGTRSGNFALAHQ
jgi:hypothetical protein